MIYVFEGSRNSGKSYLSKSCSFQTGIPRFQYSFVDWFRFLNLDSKNPETHKFALGKESMLLQLNRDGILKDSIVDRGIFSALSWGVLENRISLEEAKNQLDFFHQNNLLEKIFFIVVSGKNPEGQREKDEWSDSLSFLEKEILSSLIDHAETNLNPINILRIENNFDPSTVDHLERELKKLIKCAES